MRTSRARPGRREFLPRRGRPVDDSIQQGSTLTGGSRSVPAGLRLAPVNPPSSLRSPPVTVAFYQIDIDTSIRSPTFYLKTIEDLRRSDVNTACAHRPPVGRIEQPRTLGRLRHIFRG